MNKLIILLLSLAFSVNASAAKMADWVEDGHQVGCAQTKSSGTTGKRVPMRIYNTPNVNDYLNSVANNELYFWATAKKGKFIKIRQFKKTGDVLDGNVIGWVPLEDLDIMENRVCNMFGK